MLRWMFFVYGVSCHLLFLATYAYMAGFVGDFLTPHSIDSASAGGLAAAGVAASSIQIASSGSGAARLIAATAAPSDFVAVFGWNVVNSVEDYRAAFRDAGKLRAE